MLGQTTFVLLASCTYQIFHQRVNWICYSSNGKGLYMFVLVLIELQGIYHMKSIHLEYIDSRGKIDVYTRMISMFLKHIS